MDTGFNYYFGADPSEYDLVVSNSEGGLERLREMGARRAEAVFWGADPELFHPHDGREGDRRLLLRLRRQVPPGVDGGDDRRAEPAARRRLRRSAAATSAATSAVRACRGDVPFNVFSRAISAARINLNVTRRAHAEVHASSTCRPFELAMSGATIVSNPHDGIDRWFEPGRELLVVSNAEEATAAYQELLDDPGRAEEMGRAARERALDEHTYLHRARRLLDLLGIGSGAGAGKAEAVRG